MIQETSLQAYYQEIAPRLGQKQMKVFEALVFGGPMTNSEISDYLKIQINTTTPRTFELRALGLVVEKERRPCKITGRSAIVWSVNRVTQPTLI